MNNYKLWDAYDEDWFQYSTRDEIKKHLEDTLNYMLDDDYLTNTDRENYIERSAIYKYKSSPALKIDGRGGFNIEIEEF